MKLFISTITVLLTVMRTLSAQGLVPNKVDVAISKWIATHIARFSFGIKAGYNVARITGQTASYKPRETDGFTLAAFVSPRHCSGSYRSAFLFSRQGSSFAESGKRASISNAGIYLPQLSTSGITTFLQIQPGERVSYLLKYGKKRASSARLMDITSFANRLDYGGTLGADQYPFHGFILSAWYSYSPGDAYKRV
jgi:hypothetical protein